MGDLVEARRDVRVQDPLIGVGSQQVDLGDRVLGATRAVTSIKAKVKTITRQGTNNSLTDLLRQLNPVLRGWTNYFRHAVAKQTFSYLEEYTWRRVIGWLRRKYHRGNWKQLRRRLGG